MKNYQIIFILSAKANTKAEIRKTVTSLLEEHQVKIESIDDWDERTLFTPINKEEKGLFTIFHCEIDPKKIAQLNKDLQIRPEILQHMVKKKV